MNYSPQIRSALESDAAAVAGLFAQLGYPSDAEEMRMRIAMIVGDRSHWCAVAVKKELVGCCHLFCSPILEAGLVAHVGGLVVDVAHRGEGIGRDLMKAAESWALEKSCVSVYVRSNVLRKEAHAFYEAIGYRNAKTQHAFRKKLKANQSSEPILPAVAFNIPQK